MGKISKPLVSVIVPFYGSFDKRRLELTLESIRAQKEVNIEIVVSEQGTKPVFESVKNIEHIFSCCKLSKYFNPGLIRNAGINISSGEFLYTNDADILFLDENYLSSLLDSLLQDENLVFYRPLMRRLPLDNFEGFNRVVLKTDIKKALSSLDYSQSFLATIDGKHRDLKIVVKRGEEDYDKIFTTSMNNFNKYLIDSSLKGKEPIIWSENLHCGGNFLRRRHFDLVGGYCEEFVTWGCEDSDLQWKLGSYFKLKKVPEQFEVLHLDHEKTYFSSEMWKRNEGICVKRRQRGVSSAIEEDKNGR